MLPRRLGLPAQDAESLHPNVLHQDWERIFEVLGTVGVLAILIERALSILFEHRYFLARFGERGAKEIIAFAVSAAVCIYFDFDALAMIMVPPKTSYFGLILTGAVVAGGSKGSVKLFRDMLGWRSTAYEAKEANATPGAQPAPAPASPKPPGGSS